VQAELEDWLRRFDKLREEEERKLAKPPIIREGGTSTGEATEITIRFSCPRCDQHIEVNASAGGQALFCPACGQEILVPMS
jgi:predicted RNA-binding Zn-ribbon protein involved in translation (DUF1610 family)